MAHKQLYDYEPKSRFFSEELIPSSQRKMYRGGLKDSSEKELNIYFYDDDADQKALIDATKVQQTVRVRHQWPNGTMASYDLKLLGYQIMSGSADGFMQLKVSGRQASDVVWSNAEQTTENEGE